MDVLAALGPTWVKIGQVLSARVDLLPDTYIRVLKTLQDKVRWRLTGGRTDIQADCRDG